MQLYRPLANTPGLSGRDNSKLSDNKEVSFNDYPNRITMKELARSATTWLLSHAIYVFVGFCIFMGAFYQFVNGKNIENLTVGKRIFSQFVAVLVVGIGAAYLIDEKHWNTYAISVLGVFAGMGADKILRMTLKLIDDSSSLIDFFGRIGRAFRAGWKTYNTITGKDNDETE